MTTPQSPAGLPLATVISSGHDDDQENAAGPAVGAADVEADKARSGADAAEPGAANQDSDGVPVGEDDLAADKRASGA